MRSASALNRATSAVSTDTLRHKLAQQRTGTADSDAVYTIRPNFQKKFRPPIIKDVIHEVLMDFLGDKDYDVTKLEKWSVEIRQEILKRLNALELDRYKFVVLVVLGEQKCVSAKMISNCHWDLDTDNHAQDLFVNNTMFCAAAVYGVFHY